MRRVRASARWVATLPTSSEFVARVAAELEMAAAQDRCSEELLAAAFNVYVVTSVQDLRSDYRLGIGSLELDLSALQLPVGETHVDASVDVGDLHVIVPAGVALRVHGTTEVGEVDLPGNVGGDGRNVESDFVTTGKRVLVLDAHAGLGSVRVERAVR